MNQLLQFQASVAVQRSVSILSLPVDILVLILAYFSYLEVATLRIVCTTFNKACMKYLTSGYFKGRELLESTLKTVDAKLPLRKALRDNHPLLESSWLLYDVRGKLR